MPPHTFTVQSMNYMQVQIESMHVQIYTWIVDIFPGDQKPMICWRPDYVERNTYMYVCNAITHQ